MNKILYRFSSSDSWQEKSVSDEELNDEVLYLFEIGYQIKKGD